MSDTATPTAEPTAPAFTVRYEWGPDVPVAYQPPRLPGVRDDAHVVFLRFDEMTGDVHFELAAHDPNHENAPAAVHLVLYAPGAAIHAHAADAIAASAGGDHPSVRTEVSVTDPAQATAVVLGRPASAKANVAYTAKTVLEFHDAPTPPAV